MKSLLTFKAKLKKQFYAKKRDCEMEMEKKFQLN